MLIDTVYLQKVINDHNVCSFIKLIIFILYYLLILDKCELSGIVACIIDSSKRWVSSSNLHKHNFSSVQQEIPGYLGLVLI